MKKTWLLVVDRDVCIGAGACVAASKRFTLDDDYRSVAVEMSIEPDDAVLSAAQACPVDAICITDATTKKSIYP
jgi:ferredoxin